MQKIQIPFEKIAKNLFSYVCSLYLPEERFPYPLQKGGKGSLLGTVFATYIAFMLRQEERLPGRKRIVEEILGLRDPDSGLFQDPGIEPSHFLNPEGHSPLYTTLQSSCFCLAALNALDVEFDKRVLWLSPLLERGKIERWLDGLDWNNPWLVSNLDMFLGIFLLEWQSCDQNNARIADALEAYFRWHDDRQSKTTGYWGNQDDALNAMAGAYHIFLHYDYCGKTINHADKAIDATLGLVWRDGLFVYGGGGGSCEDMDAIDILARLSLVTDHKQGDVAELLKKSAYVLFLGQAADGGFSWRLQPNLKKLAKMVGNGADLSLIYGMAKAFLYKVLNHSHYCSTHYYSSLTVYPFESNRSDMWSSWFRPLALALIARRYPNCFETACNWRMPCWPGLGYDPFISISNLNALPKQK